MNRLTMIAAALVIAAPTTVVAGADDFAPYAQVLTDRLVIGTADLEAAIESGDLEAAKAAWIAARPAWETGETFYGEFFPSYDEAIDTWPDAQRGFHAIERILFEENSLVGTHEMARELSEQSSALDDVISDTQMTDQGLLNGLAGLTFEIGADKVGGGESPYSDTSLEDMQDNLDGIEATYAVAFAPTVDEAAPDLHSRIVDHIAALEFALAVDSLAEMDATEVTALSEELALSFADAAEPLGLDTPRIGQ